MHAEIKGKFFVFQSDGANLTTNIWTFHVANLFEDVMKIVPQLCNF